MTTMIRTADPAPALPSVYAFRAGEKELIERQAAALRFPIVGRLSRCIDRERSNRDSCFLDEADNIYWVRFGILTIQGADGRVY